MFSKEKEFSENNRSCQCSQRILSNVKWDIVTPSAEVAVESSTCWLGAGPGEPDLTADTQWRASQNPIYLVSGQQGGVCMLLLTQGWPACLALQSIPAPHLAWLHPRGTVSDSFLRFRARPWSHLPESSFCWGWSVLRVYSYYPHTLPGRWLISTLADLWYDLLALSVSRPCILFAMENLTT